MEENKNEIVLSLEEIKRLPAREAISALNKYIEAHPDSDEAYTVRGMKYWSLNLRKEAINDYHAALKINPESKASMALQFANSILDYYNKDLLNP